MTQVKERTAMDMFISMLVEGAEVAMQPEVHFNQHLTSDEALCLIVEDQAEGEPDGMPSVEINAPEVVAVDDTEIVRRASHRAYDVMPTDRQYDNIGMLSAKEVYII